MEEIELKIRNDQVDGVGPWHWLKSDDQAWSGPHVEWNSLKDAWLKYVKQRDFVVQAGGNQGLYPKLFKKYFKTVLTFEPDWENFYCLNLNCSDKNIIKVNAALGAESKFVSMDRNGMNAGMHTIKNELGSVAMVKLDDFNIPACDLIQLDIEGYEINALLGGQETIKKFKPIISCERVDATVENFLGDLGYNKVEQVHSDVIYIPRG